MVECVSEFAINCDDFVRSFLVEKFKFSNERECEGVHSYSFNCYLFERSELIIAFAMLSIIFTLTFIYCCCK